MLIGDKVGFTSQVSRYIHISMYILSNLFYLCVNGSCNNIASLMWYVWS